MSRKDFSAGPIEKCNKMLKNVGFLYMYVCYRVAISSFFVTEICSIQFVDSNP
jgi:hypothetical protein